MTFSLGRDIAAEIHPVYAAASTAATAGGSGDDTEVTGATIDTATLPARFESVAFTLTATATLAATETLTLAALIETSDDGSTWTTALESATVLTLTGESGGSTETGAAVIGKPLENCGQYVRVKFTPDLSASATDTATIQSAAIFGGADKLPVS